MATVVAGRKLDMDLIAMKNRRGLYVGAWEAADALVESREPGWAIICVLENPRAEDHRPETLRYPALVPGTGGALTEWVATPQSLENIARVIDEQLSWFGRNVLCHCGVGQERSPLAASWWLRTRAGMSLDEAYARLKRRRPCVGDRRTWMSLSARTFGD